MPVEQRYNELTGEFEPAYVEPPIDDMTLGKLHRERAELKLEADLKVFRSCLVKAEAALRAANDLPPGETVREELERKKAVGTAFARVATLDLAIHDIEEELGIKK